MAAQQARGALVGCDEHQVGEALLEIHLWLTVVERAVQLRKVVPQQVGVGGWANASRVSRAARG